jgi:LAO/AO transport system kinase
LLDAYGKDIILIETVGVGQSEVDVMERTDTVLVVLCPESGDAIQTMKAGLFEIADIFVVNKSDHPGGDNLIHDIQAMLQLRDTSWWNIPVVATEAVNDIGIEELYRQTQLHHQALCKDDRLPQRRRLQRKQDFMKTLERKLARKLLTLIEQDGQLSIYVERVEKGEIDPYSAVDEILRSGGLLTDWLRQQP